MANLRDIVRQLADNGRPAYGKVCVVTAVDAAARTADCEPLDETAPILGATLQAGEGLDSGVLAVPVVGSHVVCVPVAGGEAWAVALCEEIESADVRIGNAYAGISGGEASVTVGGATVTVRDGRVSVTAGDTEVTVDGEKVTADRGGRRLALTDGGAELSVDGTKVSLTPGGVSVTDGSGGTLRMSGGTVTVNGGANGGSVNAGELRETLEGIKEYCGKLKDAVSAGFAAVGESTGASGAAGASAFDNRMAGEGIEIKTMEDPMTRH